MKTIKSGRVVADIRRDEMHARNSEGAFLRTRDGGIYFAFSRFEPDCADDDAPCGIWAMRSGDEGETWSEPVQLVKSGHLGIKTWMSVSLLRMENGDLGLFVGAKRDLTLIRFYLLRSRDEGESFYEEKECTLHDRAGYYVMNNDRVVRLSTGRLIMPLSYHRNGYSDEGVGYYDLRAQIYFLYSDDDGRTWREAEQGISCAVNATNTRFQEPGVIELKENVLMAFLRTDLHVQYESFSFDGGMRWTLAQPSRFTSPPSPMQMKRDEKTGLIYCAWNPIPCYNGRDISPAGWGRTPLVLAVSSDDGETFSEPLVVEGKPDHGYCYPALFFTDDDALLIAYCSGGPDDGMCLTRLTIMKIPNAEVRDGSANDES